MLKKVLIILFLVIFIISTTMSYATSVTLSQIADKFNNCLTVKHYANDGVVWNAKASNDKIIVSLKANDNTTSLEYILNESVLSINLSGDNVLNGVMATTVLVDCIGQLHGYSDGELFSTLNSDKITNYTVEKEGFEVKQLSNENYQIKVDINKKIPLIDASNIFIEVSDLEDLKKYISGDGSAQQSKGNIIFNKSGYDNDMTVFVGEKEKLTDNTYKSILSILQVMFDSKDVVNYFKENYSGISVGNKEFSGFKVQINPEKSSMENTVLGEDDTYKFVRINIDKNLVNLALNGNTVGKTDGTDTKNDNDESKTKTSDKKVDNTKSIKTLPKAGQNIKMFLVIIVSVIFLIISIIKIYNYRDVK